MFSKADTHKQLFQLLLTIQGLRKKLIFWDNDANGLRNSWHFVTPPLVSLRNEVLETSTEISYWPLITTRIWVVLLIDQSKFLMQQNWSEALPWLEKWCVMNMEFLHSYLKFHFGGVVKCRLFLRLWSKHRTTVKAQFCYLRACLQGERFILVLGLHE